MKSVAQKGSASQAGDEAQPPGGRWRYASLPAWLLCWEVYLIVAVAALLRLYQINTTEFDGDQAVIFGMARYALQHGLLVATSNYASIRILNPPGIIYLLMVPAAISADPVGAAILTALCAVAAVLLCYLFMRRYYGRLAGTIAALIFATASRAVFYSRFSWQQNLLPLVAILFMFALFRGAVEKRTGWPAPALLLLGLAIQLHATGAFLIVPLAIALLLAPGMLRWRDLALGILLLLLIYSTYIVWEVAAHFSDIQILLTPTGKPSKIDNWALYFYQLMISPYAVPFTNTSSILHRLIPVLFWLHDTMTALFIGGGLLALLSSLWPAKSGANEAAESRGGWRWWKNLRADPYRCGLLILFGWQITPLVALSRHALPIYPHYFIIIMPGCFMLIGLFIAKLAAWFQRHGTWGNVVRFAFYTLAAAIIVAQLLGTGADVLDTVRGHFHDYDRSTPYYNDLASLEHALASADQLAMERHLSRVYVTTDVATNQALSYLATDTHDFHTPMTLFDATSCLLLPAPADGPAALLVGPYSSFTRELLAHFTKATLVSEPPRLGGSPFRLYIVDPPVSQQAAQGAFAGNLQLLDAHAQSFGFAGASWLVTRWSLLRSAAPAFGTNYSYKLTAAVGGSNGSSAESRCVLNSMRAGDDLLVAFKRPAAGSGSASLTISAQFQVSNPYTFSNGLFAFETGAQRLTAWMMLVTAGGDKFLQIVS
jgi:4-amino-4-deoxy-L-arabinose transferase-like glycosyltransferase